MIVPITEVVAIRSGKEYYRNALAPGEYTVGRDSTCTIRVDASNVSRIHARLTLRYSDWMIEDLGSSNGTWVSGQRITGPTLFFPRQDLQVGNVDLLVSRVPGTPDLEETRAPQSLTVERFLPPELRGDRRYKVLRMIAMGGMGAVLEVDDKALRRRVAMKVLLDVDSPEKIARFIEEAQVTAQLAHPNIIPVYDINVNERENPFFTMRLLDGVSLGSILASMHQGDPRATEKFPLEELLRIIGKVCDALSFAHASGVVHRDLKPDNVMIGPYGEVLVIDWGLAKPLGNDLLGERPTESNQQVTSARADAGAEFATSDYGVVGTPKFMAPEQACGEIKTIDPRTDIYMIGALLYQALTLRSPVEGTDPAQVIAAVAAGQIEPIDLNAKRKHWRGAVFMRELADIAMKALARERRDRYATARDFQIAMRRAYLPAFSGNSTEMRYRSAAER